MAQVKAVPDGYHTATPFLNVRGAAKAIDFYKKALGAVERGRMAGPDGTVMHAEIQIGDSVIMMSEATGRPPTSSNTFLYVADVDALFKRAVDAGATVVMPPANQFWGDRYGVVSDEFGNVWSMGTHVEDVPMEDMERRMKAAMAERKQ